MKWIASLAIALAALQQALATNSTSCTPRLISYYINANATLSQVESVDAGGGFREAGNVAFPYNATNLPSLCVVSFVARTSEGAQYKFGVFLPDEWNNKILTVGNDGFSGGINWPAMGTGAKYGFATIATDGGHSSTANDLAWARASNETRLLFSHKALHGSLQLAQRVIERYYGLPPTASYFSGTSDGGRQGLKAAELYPRDYSALLIGAPAWWQSQLQSWRIARAKSNLPAGKPKIFQTRNLTFFADSIRKQCDAADGVADGIISNPTNCTVKLDLFTCKKTGVNANGCLTPEQASVAQGMYANFPVGNRGNVPGVYPGSEYEWGAVLGDQPNDMAVGYMKNFVYNNSNWAWSRYDDAVFRYANATNPGQLDVNQFNLAQFASLGGKIIMYHGLADANVPAAASRYFYDQIVARSGGNVATVRNWFRLFFLPGVGHKTTTAGANAPWYIGGPGQAEQLLGRDNSTTASDARSDALRALQLWVEAGIAPQSILASTWRTANNPSSGVFRQRPICPYPSTQRYNLTGDPSKPASFACLG